MYDTKLVDGQNTQIYKHNMLYYISDMINSIRLVRLNVF